MFKKTLVSILALSAFAGLAHADDEHARQADFAATGLGWFVRDIGAMQEPSARGPAGSMDVSECYSIAERYELAPDDLIVSDDFKILPFAVDPGVTSYRQYGIPYKRVKDVCKLFTDLQARALTLQPLGEIREKVVAASTAGLRFEDIDWYSAVKSDMPLHYGSAELVTECNAAVDKVIAAGIKADLAITFSESVSLTPDQLRASCQKQKDDGDAFAAEAMAWCKAKYAEVEAPFKKAGIKGKRLDLFVYYPGGWLVAGCSKLVEDPKKLKKAKKLFSWLEDDYGTITLVKYTFKGDNYTVDSREFTYPEAAYAWCK